MISKLEYNFTEWNFPMIDPEFIFHNPNAKKEPSKDSPVLIADSGIKYFRNSNEKDNNDFFDLVQQTSFKLIDNPFPYIDMKFDQYLKAVKIIQKFYKN